MLQMTSPVTQMDCTTSFDPVCSFAVFTKSKKSSESLAKWFGWSYEHTLWINDSSSKSLSSPWHNKFNLPSLRLNATRWRKLEISMRYAYNTQRSAHLRSQYPWMCVFIISREFGKLKKSKEEIKYTHTNSLEKKVELNHFPFIHFLFLFMIFQCSSSISNYIVTNQFMV